MKMPIRSISRLRANARRLPICPSLLVLTVVFSTSAIRGATLVEQYWPMHDEDIKFYSNKSHQAYLQFRAQDTLGEFNFSVYEFDPEFGDYDETATAIVGYANGAMIEYGIRRGWNSADWRPPLEVLTDDLLAGGGTKHFQTTVQISGISIPVSGTVSIKNAGTVVVPAGKYNNCRTVSLKAIATYQGRKLPASSEAYTLAPGVGQIRIAYSNSRGIILGWLELTGGTVGGIGVREFANKVPVETKKPTVTFRFPKNGARATNEVITIEGTATDNAGVDRVMYQLNGGDWMTAVGSASWSAAVTLSLGRNQVRVYAVDVNGNVSRTRRLVLRFKPVN